MENLGNTALIYYLSIVALTAFGFWHLGRIGAYREIAMAAGVEPDALIDEVAKFQEKN